MESPTKAEIEPLTTSEKDTEVAAMETEETSEKKEEPVTEKTEAEVRDW